MSHGLATDLTMWDGLAAVLAGRWRVLRYDARGHGRTPSTPGDYTLEQLGADVIGLLDALGIARTHFVGLSMGGMVGMGLGLNHPGRLLSLAVCDARAVAPPDYRAAWTDRAAKVRAEGMEAIVEPTLSRWFTPAFGRHDPSAREAVRRMIRRTSVEGYAGCAAALRGLDYLHRLGDLRLPVLFLGGAEDQGAPVEAMRAMHHATPGSRHVVIPNAGHLANLEQPEAFHAAVVDFLVACEDKH
ncbi:MAG: alpha/beta fold hydrolase [Acetobacteraceae bacterium]|nr:alpha/beta fold hydrolase [Acetobacteraceae bacterium]